MAAKKLKFFSVLSGSDEDYRPFYDNFLFHLGKVGLKEEHELVKLDMKAGLWQSDDFIKVTMAKLDYTRKFLKEGFTVFLSDLDIVFLKNPLPYFSSLLKEKDIAFQFSSKGIPSTYNPFPPNKNVNTGFYIAKPTALNIDLFDTREQIEIIGGDHSDQGYIQAKIQRIKKYQELRQGILPPPLFPNGHYWFNNHGDLDPYIVHYNFLIKQGAKINKMKKHNHWKA
jgi:hypothetical protein